MKKKYLQIVYSDSGSRNTEDPYSNSPFSIIEGSFSWDQALADAESRGGRLAVLDTQDKINDSLLILSAADYPKVWIGLRDHDNDNVDTWINGSPVSANNYGEGQPDKFGEIHIRTIEPNSIYGDPGQWLDEDSWKSFSYLLETPIDTTDQDSLFEIIEGSYTWHEAKLDAESKGGRLAVLNTQDKINTAKAFIIDMTTDNYIPKVWIGCTDEESEGEWLWIDGTSVTLNDWGPEQPDNHGGGNQHYASFTDNAVWDDAQLNWVWSNGYLLEMD